LDSAIRVVFAEIQGKARLVKQYTDVPLVMANAGQLGQVFVNLLLNATYAVGDGGPDDNVIRVSTAAVSDQVLVEVSDSGEGIPVEVQSHIFDPFFTTKPAGVGTGLGLSICHGIVQSLGGTISVDSEAGRGSVFRITLPRSTQTAGSSFPPPAGTPIPARRGRVLVVDDQSLVAHAVKSLLDAHHDVSVATSGAEALEVLTADPSGFDVVLCDLHMAGISGIDLYERLVAGVPETAKRMVFMTGGAFTDRSRDFLARVKNRCIDKPIDPTLLRNLIDNRLRNAG
jgi:CheY-like chemotaxis protein